jgi:integrase
MSNSYDVRVWKTEKYEGRKVTTYTVRWAVAGKPWREPHRTAALAESFRSDLIAATRKGEAFDIATGRPVSMVRRETPDITWYEFACDYVDMKWPTISGHHRKGVAQALLAVTPAMLTVDMDDRTAKEVRSALLNWGFNTRQRGTDNQPAHVTERLSWVARNSRPLADIARPDVIRAALDAAASKVDGSRAAGRTAHRKRAVLSNALGYAVELGLLQVNPIGTIKWTAPKSTHMVDRRVVVNPTQARQLLDTVRITPRSGDRLVGFFACIYYAALRPEEAVDLREDNLDLPETGRGWLIIVGAAPETGRAWSDSGDRRDARQLKHRAVGETRRVPCPPELTEILRNHLKEFGTDPEGRLFRGERGDLLATVTYTRMWDRARKEASPLARRPYDLRHAAVSTWLNGGVGPARVAEWAGHSVDVLLRIYTKCIDGQEDVDLRRIDNALEDQGGAEQTDPTRTSNDPPPSAPSEG